MTGRKWAYFGVFLGFTASITANVASTVLKDTTISLGLRVPFAVFWPLATYVAIEVLVRIAWQRTWSHHLVRLMIAGPVAIVGAFVSYLHQHHLMMLAGEPGLAQGFGPLAVDGMLFGMTAALIVTRPRKAESGHPYFDALEKRWQDNPTEIGASQPIEPDIDWDKELQEWSNPVPVSPAPREVPVSAPPLSEEKAPRAPRSSWDVEKVVDMLLRGEKGGDIISATGIGRSTLARYSAALRELRQDPSGQIDPKHRIPAAHAPLLRELVSK